MLGMKIMGLVMATLLNGVNAENLENVGFYPMTTVVVEVETDYVTVVDFNGNEWAFENVGEDWYEGDIASLIMCDNGTEIIYDDIIVSASYDGWLEGWVDPLQIR